MELKEKDEKVYYTELESKINELEDNQKGLGNLLFKAIEMGKYNSYYDNEITKEIKHSFNNNLNDVAEVAEKLLGSYLASLFKYIINHEVEYSYNTSCCGRPYRVSDIEVHVGYLAYMLELISKVSIYEFSIMDYLTIPDYDEFNYIDNDILSNMIAFEIDNENNDVINALKEIIYGDNNTALFSSTMIQGIFKSHNKEMYKIMGELLISARLQEGLRNSIVNEIADGTICF